MVEKITAIRFAHSKAKMRENVPLHLDVFLLMDEHKHHQ